MFLGEEKYINRAEETDKQLRKALNFWDITYLVVGAMIGSGWLFGALYASSVVGPGSILSWIVAGVLMFFIALVFAEISGMIPKTGSIVRYPQYSHGSFASFILAWSYLLSAITVAPAEAEAVITYMSSYVPGLTTTVSGLTVLTGLGIIVAFIFLTFFFLLNYYGVHVMGKTNTGVGWWKLLVPLITIILLISLFFHPKNFATPSFLPYGSSPILFAIPTTGIAFAYLGFRQGLEYAGEAKNPKRDVPLGTILGFIIVVAIYVLLQVAFIGGVDWGKVSTASGVTIAPGNWTGLSSSVLANGPFYEILKISAIPILVGWGIFLLIDAIVSPSGTGWIYEGTTTRVFYGMAADGHLPDLFLKLNKHKIPIFSLIASWLIGALFLLPYPAWVKIAGFISSTTVFTYMISGSALVVLRKTAPNAHRPLKLPVPWILGGIAFIASFLIVYWSTFSILWGVDALILAGIPIFYIYTMPKRLGSNLTLGIVLGVIYWITLAVTTIYFLDYGIVAKVASYYTMEPIPSFSVILSHTAPNFVLWVVINVITTVLFTYILYRGLPTAYSKSQIKAGFWVIATIFAGLIVSYLSSLGPYMPNYSIIPYPWDTVLAVVVAAVLFVYSALSGILTDDLVAVMKGLGIDITKDNNK
ncbi:APC family permease [Caldisphaera lagunensis]|uniref:APC family permease n=1 Tax=Caldisphaera lagunensis TaxID=200415 RepID=UPI00066219D8